jgi:hypothetical protein
MNYSIYLHRSSSENSSSKLGFSILPQSTEDYDYSPAKHTFAKSDGSFVESDPFAGHVSLAKDFKLVEAIAITQLLAKAASLGLDYHSVRKDVMSLGEELLMNKHGVSVRYLTLTSTLRAFWK